MINMSIPESYIPIINIVLAVWMVLAIIMGYKKGLLWELLRILGFAAALFVAWIVSPGISSLIQIVPKSWTPFAGTSVGALLYDRLNYLSWFLIILVIGLIFLCILKPMFKAISEIPVMKEINGVLGAMLSAVIALFYMMILTFVLNSALIKNGKDIVSQSGFKYVQMVANNGISFIADKFGENVAIQKMLSDPLSLTEEDLKSIVEWLNASKLSGEQIKNFLKEYGIDINKINDLIGQ